MFAFVDDLCVGVLRLWALIGSIWLGSFGFVYSVLLIAVVDADELIAIAAKVIGVHAAGGAVRQAGTTPEAVCDFPPEIR